MKIKIVLAKVISLFVTFYLAPCSAELPSSYGAPPKQGPAPLYGPPSASSNSKPSPSSPSDSSGANPDSEKAVEPEPFNFAYEVKDATTGNEFSHRQESDGKKVSGEYKVLLPDGRNQVVSYTADEAGFNAEIKYDGEANPAPDGKNAIPNPAPAAPKPGAPSPSSGYPSGGPPGGPADLSPPPAPTGYPRGPNKSPPSKPANTYLPPN